MSNYVFYDSPERKTQLCLVKNRHFCKHGKPTVDEMYAKFVDQYPRLIVVEQNYGEKIIERGPELGLKQLLE